MTSPPPFFFFTRAGLNRGGGPRNYPGWPLLWALGVHESSKEMIVVRPGNVVMEGSVTWINLLQSTSPSLHKCLSCSHTSWIPALAPTHLTFLVHNHSKKSKTFPVVVAVIVPCCSSRCQRCSRPTDSRLHEFKHVALTCQHATNTGRPELHFPLAVNLFNVREL